MIAKSKLNRIVSALLSAVVLLTVLLSAPFSVDAYVPEGSYVIDGMVFKTHHSGEYVYLSHVLPLQLPEDVVIPETVDGLPVRGLGYHTFESTEKRPINIKSIVIPEGTQSLGIQLFMNCKSLESVTLPESLERIEREVFLGCTALKTINFPSNLETIGYYAFMDCSSLLQAHFSEGLTYLDYMVFRNCTSLESVMLPGSLTYMGQSAFNGCTNLKTVDIPLDGKHSTLEYSVFENCSSLEYICIPAGVGPISNQAFNNCTSLKTVEFSQNNKVNYIGEKAFNNCTSLETVTFSENNKLEVIDTSAFENCDKLETMNFDSLNQLTTIQNSAFKGCKKLRTINFEELPLLEIIGRGAFYGCESIERLYVPQYVTTIPDQAFYNCYNLKEVVFQKNHNFSLVGVEAFKNCFSLTSIHFPNKTTRINDRAFENCYYLSEVTFGRELQHIGEFAFVNCAMTEIVLPRSIDYMGYYSVGFLADEEYVYWIPDFTIYGEYNTVAQLYAETFEINFKLKYPHLFRISNKDEGIFLVFESLRGINTQNGGYYRIYRKTADTSWQKLTDVKVGSYVDKNVVPGVEYTYTVKYFGSDGTESLRDENGISITRLLTTKVTKIQNTEKGIKLTWDKIEGAYEYRVYTKYSDGRLNEVGSTQDTTFVREDVFSGHTYTFVVKAFDNEGRESSFDEDGYTIQFIATPQISSITSTEKGVKITWGKVEGAVNYRVYYKNGSDWKGIGNTTSTTFTHTDATPGVKYTYTVRCMKSDGKTAVSDYSKQGKSHTYFYRGSMASMHKAMQKIKGNSTATEPAQKSSGVLKPQAEKSALVSAMKQVAVQLSSKFKSFAKR